jgi:hypothetical protein
MRHGYAYADLFQSPHYSADRANPKTGRVAENNGILVADRNEPMATMCQAKLKYVEVVISGRSRNGPKQK